MCIHELTALLKVVKEELDRKNFQLLGVTCMWIASKIHEEAAPDVADFAWITYDTYTVDQLRNMEQQVMNDLRATISHWVPLKYIVDVVFRLPAFASNVDLKFAIGFLHDLVLQQADLLVQNPDAIAAAICYAAVSIVEPALHTKLVSQRTLDYVLLSNYDELHILIRQILLLPDKANKYEDKWQAVLTKYRKPNRNAIACKYFHAKQLPDDHA